MLPFVVVLSVVSDVGTQVAVEDVGLAAAGTDGLVAAPEDAAGAVDGVASDAAAGDESLAVACAGLSDVAGFLPPSRKSVTYQPDPLSWNPAAVTCLT